jgi:hypothetical protein
MRRRVEEGQKNSDPLPVSSSFSGIRRRYPGFAAFALKRFPMSAMLNRAFPKKGTWINGQYVEHVTAGRR